MISQRPAEAAGAPERATLNQVAGNLGIPSESALLRIGITHDYMRLICGGQSLINTLLWLAPTCAVLTFWTRISLTNN